MRQHECVKRVTCVYVYLYECALVCVRVWSAVGTRKQLHLLQVYSSKLLWSSVEVFPNQSYSQQPFPERSVTRHSENHLQMESGLVAWNQLRQAESP